MTIEEALFAAALERPPTAERHAFLDEACGGDVMLHDRVQCLLSAHERTHGILELPATPHAKSDASWSLLDDVLRDQGIAPAVVGRYKLIEAIGEGGMGTVWLAEQTDPVRRKVAVKLVKAGMASKSVLARLEAERQALALMDHPNIAKVLDGGATADGRPYFVMEFVEGVPLTQHCDAARLTIPQRLELFVSVCQAVQHAHTKGVIHRDLKPSNVMVTLYDGEPVPKVIDFGVAKATGERFADDTILTKFGQLIGTPLYMSPEQAEMGGVDVDARSDVYALGVLLYELLTGSTPFEGKGSGEPAFIEMLRIIREKEPQKPSRRLATTKELPIIAGRRRTESARLCRMVKGELDWIVMKALEKDRARRYDTASALAMDVQNYLRHEPVAACPPTMRYRLRKFVRRNKVPVVAASVVAVALVSGLVASTWNMIRATDALEIAQRSERVARDQLFDALLNRARAGRFNRQMGQRIDSLAALAQAARIRPDDRLRDEATAALALPDIRRLPIQRSLPSGSTGITYSGNYSLYARADAQGFVTIRSVDDDREVRRIDSGPITRGYLYFSPDDRYLLGFAAGSALRVWRVTDGRLVLPADLRDCRAHAFSPDGHLLAVSQHEQMICFDLASGQEVARWRQPERVHRMAFHPNNRELAVGYTNSKVASVFDVVSGALLANLPVGTMNSQVVAWHPDGRRLAISGSDPRIQIWDVAAKRQAATLLGHVQIVTDLTFHPEGGLLASYSWDGVLRLWEPSTGRTLLQLPLSVDGRPRFSPDGRWMGTAQKGQGAELLEVTPSQVYRTFASGAGIDKGAFTPSDISPDGRLLAVGMDNGTEPGVRLWDLRGGRELAALPRGTNSVVFNEVRARAKCAGRACKPGIEILTCGLDGLQRWPLTSDDPDGRHLRLGQPRQVSHINRAWLTRGADGRALAATAENGGSNKILDSETGAVRREFGAHPQGEIRAISSDGRWAASSGWHSDRVRLWNVATGRMVHEWVLGKRTFVSFTPDSRTLIISREDEFSFWDVATLQPIRRLRRDVAHFPSHVAFSADGKLMALEMAPGVIHLVEAETGRTVAKLEDPHGDRATWQGFTPDGTQLVVVSSYANSIHTWDLREVRTRLKQMNLDWDWPAFAPLSPGNATPEVATIEASFRDRATQQTIERWRRAVEADPNASYPCNNLAWAYLMAPEPLRNVDAALLLAEKAVSKSPASAMCRNTLGLAYYRAGRYREAADLLQPNLQASDDKYLALDLYILAMAHQALGEEARARDFYHWAVRWVATQRDLSALDIDELTALRTEAAALLGIDRKQSETPEPKTKARSAAPGL